VEYDLGGESESTVPVPSRAKPAPREHKDDIGSAIRIAGKAQVLWRTCGVDSSGQPNVGDISIGFI
jgi:hypothetical protein